MLFTHYMIKADQAIFMNKVFLQPYKIRTNTVLYAQIEDYRPINRLKIFTLFGT